MKRSRIEYFLRVAKAVASASKCARRRFGAILVKSGDIVSTGYNGSVRGAINCGTDTDIGCIKNLWNEKRGISYVHCPAIHAEHNACLNAGRPLALGTTMFLAKSSGDGMSGPPCQGCRRVMIQSGIKDMYYYNIDGDIVHNFVKDWIELENEWIRNESNVRNPVDL